MACRQVCTEPGDYFNPSEPGAEGRKIAEAGGWGLPSAEPASRGLPRMEARDDLDHAPIETIVEGIGETWEQRSPDPHGDLWTSLREFRNKLYHPFQRGGKGVSEAPLP